MIAGMAGGPSVASYYRSADRSDVLVMRSWMRILHSAGKDGPALEGLRPLHGLTADVDQFVVELRLVEHVPKVEADVLGFEAVSKAIHGVMASGEGGALARPSPPPRTPLCGRKGSKPIIVSRRLRCFAQPLCRRHPDRSARHPAGGVGAEGGGVNRVELNSAGRSPALDHKPFRYFMLIAILAKGSGD